MDDEAILSARPPPQLGQTVLLALKRDTGDAPPTVGLITRIYSDGSDPFPQINVHVFPHDGHSSFGLTYVKHESYARDERVCWYWPSR